MTASKQTLNSKVADSVADTNVTSPSEGYQHSGLSIGQKLRRAWLVTFGLISSCGLVTSQINFAKAQSDHIEGNYAAEGNYAVEAHHLNDPDSPLSVGLDSASPIAQPTVAAGASPTFSAPKTALKQGVSSHPLVGMIEPGIVAAPIVDYVNTPASATAYDVAASPGIEEVIPVPASSPAVEVGPESSAPISAPTISAPASVAEPVSEPVVTSAEPIVEISPEVTPEAAPVFTPAPSTEQVVPAEITPVALPEEIARPGEYDNIFVDPTDYSVGATETPDVVVAEQSTGCEFTVSQGQGVPAGACGTAALATAASSGESANGSTTGSTANATMPTSYSQPAPVASASAVNVGPVSFSESGIRLSTSAAGRAYLNRSVRPVVNLQAAAKFIFPLSAPAPISSLFGFRVHPIFGDHRFHAGTDIAAPQGTPVLAAQDGVVAAAGEAGGYGLMVVLEHELEEATLESRYAHLSEIFVASGKAVKKGEVVGLVGSTGNSTGPHLHFEMRELTADGWVLVNPDSMVQDSLARLVQALNNPSQTISFSLDDFKLKNLKLKNLGVNKTAADTEDTELLPGRNGLPYRPAQPNAS
ncbi:M23 peptidase domain protein [Synechococcus sp. PCC 7335]|uniref:M23 family metallopeptidase n=1 Tax=Synechococcus sp. (strain ATCC 29403 / PCC 7335) TaxID=91464 RepID=UPI00017EBFE2|nr:M23 family metallopeptidase [Synechococcus sp. PCC 7335]EDX84970.1 M23 peptidase domain protein [Synechococcus sp. PCC 7335]